MPCYLGRLQTCPLTAFPSFTNIPKATGPGANLTVTSTPGLPSALRSALAQQLTNSLLSSSQDCLYLQPPDPQCSPGLPYIQPAPASFPCKISECGRGFSEVPREQRTQERHTHQKKRAFAFPYGGGKYCLFLFLTAS